MEKLIKLLNEKTENKYKFMLKSALFDQSADFCMIEIFYKDGLILEKNIKEELLAQIFEVLPKEIKYDISFIKNFISEERIEGEFKTFMARHFPSISYNLKSVTLNEKTFIIDTIVDELSYDHAKKKNFDGEVQKYFKALFEEFEFVSKFESGKVFVEDELEVLKKNYKEEDVDIYEKRIIEVTDKLSIIGEEIEEPASYIKDKTEPMTGVVLCGKVSNFIFRVINTKRKKKDEDESENQQEKPVLVEPVEDENAENAQSENETKIEYEKKLFKWTLSDFTGDMKCTFMSNKENQSKIEKLDNDSVIIVRGNLEKNKFSGELELKVRDVSYCTIPEGLTEYIEWKKEKPFYEWVEPEKMVTYKQNDLMSFAVEESVPEFLQNKTFVCYDFETTGLHFEQGDKIIEIGAVKIENGKITERFMSFVDPEKHIPEESSKISGIVDEDVKGAPIDNQVLQDFYKFTRGAIIIGYNNINFDNVFLIGQGKKCRWNFDNETADVYKYATKFITGVKNYKLGTIAAKLGVVLDNAHRAVYDALATAEVFLKIAANNDLGTF